MSTIIITVEDMPNGNVSIKANPTFEEIAKKDLSGETLTNADGYAIAMLNRARQIGKSTESTNLVQIPKIYGA